MIEPTSNLVLNTLPKQAEWDVGTTPFGVFTTGSFDYDPQPFTQTPLGHRYPLLSSEGYTRAWVTAANQHWPEAHTVHLRGLLAISKSRRPCRTLNYPYIEGKTFCPLFVMRCFVGNSFDAWIRILKKSSRSVYLNVHGGRLCVYIKQDILHELYRIWEVSFVLLDNGHHCLDRVRLASSIDCYSDAADSISSDDFDVFSEVACLSTGWYEEHSDYTVFRPQSGVPSSPRLCLKERKDSSLSPKREAAKRLGISPDDFDRRKKERDLTVKRRRDAKERKDKNVFRPQGLRDLLSTTVSPSESMEAHLQAFREQADKIAEAVPQFADILGSIKSSGIDVNVSADKNLLHVPAIAALFAFGYMSSIHGGKWTKILGTTGILYLGTVAYQHRESLMTQFNAIVDRASSVRAQSLDTSVVEDVAAFVIGYLGVLNTKVIPSGLGKMRMFVKEMASFDRAKSGLSNAITFGISAVTKVINWFREEFLGMGAISLISSSIPELEAWIKKVTIVSAEATAGKLKVNTVNAARLQTILSEGQALSAKRFNAIETRQVQSALGIYLAVIRKMLLPFERANLTSGGCRMEPVIALFTGVPGVGKTFAMMPALIDVLAQTLPEEERATLADNYMNHIFPRVPETVYWEGYAGQFACIYDDFGQARDMAGQADNEFMETIRIGNIFPYTLHMASLDLKVGSYFKSQLVFCTSNQRVFQPNSITEPEAVMRRFDFIVDVVPKAEFCIDPKAYGPDRRLNKDHPDVKDVGFNKDIYEFRLMRAEKATVNPVPYATVDYDGLVGLIVQKHRERSEKASKYLAHLDGLSKPEFKPQAGGPSQVDMSDLSEFNKAFDESFTVPKRADSLDDLLKKFDERRPHQRMSQTDFVHMVEGSYPDWDWLELMRLLNDGAGTSIKKAQCAAYASYCFEPGLFVRCLHDKRSRLADFINMFKDEDHETVDLTFRDISKMEEATATLNAYCSSFKSFAATMWEKYKGLNLWAKSAITFAGLWGLLKATGLADWIDKVVGPYLPSGFNTGFGIGKKVHKSLYKDREVSAWDDPDLIQECRDSFRPEGPLHPAYYTHGDVYDRLIKSGMKDPEAFKIITKLCNVPVGLMKAWEQYRDALDAGSPDRWIRRAEYEAHLDAAVPEGSIPKEMIETWRAHMQAFIDGLTDKEKEALARASKKESLIELVEGRPKTESGGPRVRHTKFVIKSPAAVRAEGGVDQNAAEMSVSVITANQYEMTAMGGEWKFGFLTFIQGRHAILPAHFFLQVRSFIESKQMTLEDEVKLFNNLTGEYIVLTAKEFLDGLVVGTKLAKSDLALIHVANAHMHRDIRRMFVTEAQMKTTDTIPMFLVGVNTSIVKKKGQSYVTLRYGVAKKDKIQLVVSSFCDYEVEGILKYNMATKSGDCGMIAFANLTGFGPGKIMGMHVAGSDNMIGFSSICTFERLNEALKKTEFVDLPPPDESENFSPQCGPVPFDGCFELIGKLEKKVSQSGVSTRAPSVLHNLWTESPMALPCLRPTRIGGVLVDPLTTAVSRYGRPRGLVHYQPLKLAGDYVSARMMDVLATPNHSSPRAFTFEEAVLGVSSIKYCRSLPRDTSPGFPYILESHPGFSGKQWWFGKEDEYDLSRPSCQKLREECERIIALAKEGKRSDVIYNDFLKDETRKKKRVAEANTRLISSAPMAYSIVVRMYFLAWVTTLTSVNLLVGVCVGINAYSSDWDVLARSLKAKGNNILAGDFTGFDTSHCAFITELVLKMANNWYDWGQESGDERTNPDNIIREVLFADLSNSRHVVYNIVYMWITGGFPSGHPLTAIVASCVNYILHVAAWIVLHPRGVEGLSDFHKHVVFAGYGDDSLVSVSDQAIVFYNSRTIAKAMKLFGYTYTDEMKVGDEEAPLARSLKDVRFLRRSFRFEPMVGRYVAPLAIESILEMLYWTRKKNGAQITRDNVDDALRELSLHSKEDFQHWAPKVVQASRDLLHHNPLITDYVQLQKLACSLDNIW